MLLVSQMGWDLAEKRRESSSCLEVLISGLRPLSLHTLRRCPWGSRAWRSPCVFNRLTWGATPSDMGSALSVALPGPLWGLLEPP